MVQAKMGHDAWRLEFLKMIIIDGLREYPRTLLKLLASPWDGLQDLVEDSGYDHHFSFLCVSAGVFATTTIFAGKRAGLGFINFGQQAAVSIFLRTTVILLLLVPLLLQYWMFRRWSGLKSDLRRYWKFSCLVVGYTAFWIIVIILLSATGIFDWKTQESLSGTAGFAYILYIAIVQHRFWNAYFFTCVAYSFLGLILGTMGVGFIVFILLGPALRHFGI